MPSVQADIDREVHQARIRQAMADYFNRQHETFGDGTRAAADLLDPVVWLAALVAALGPPLRDITVEAGHSVAAALGAVYDTARTLAWLATHTQRVAGAVNATTLDELDAALASDDAPAAVDGLFDQLITVRAEQIAETVVTEMTAWGAREAASQAAEQLGGTATKTWRTTSARPRASHARINGQTVAEGERFANGLKWPGESGAPTAERARCRCVLEVDIEE